MSEITEAVEVRQGDSLPNINLQNAIDTATSLGPNGVAVLKELQIILRDERQWRAQVAFDQARTRVIEQLTRTGIPHDKSRPITSGVRVGYSSAMQITKSLRDAGAIDEGFTWQFDTDYIGDHPVSVCVLKHRDGHQERARSPITEGRGGKNNPATSSMDDLKATVNMGDRTALQRVWGISHLTEDIMDAETPDAVQSITDEQALELEARTHEAAEASGVAYGKLMSSMLKASGASSLDSFPAAKFQWALDGLALRIKKAEEAR